MQLTPLFDHTVGGDYRPDAVNRAFCIVFGLVLTVGAFASPGPWGGPSRALAQTTGDDDLPPALRESTLDPELHGPAEPESESPPLRIVAGIGGGATIRLVKHLDLQQERFAPSYLEVFGGVVLPVGGRIGHQVTLAVATNLSGDGSYTAGIDPLQQWTLTPAYTARISFPEDPVPDWILFGRFGVPLTLSSDFSWGLGLDVGAAYMFTAGIGVYVEIDYSMYFGADDRSGNATIHPLLSGELGVLFDIEVL